jgi:hypothetical protein
MSFYPVLPSSASDAAGEEVPGGGLNRPWFCGDSQSTGEWKDGSSTAFHKGLVRSSSLKERAGVSECPGGLASGSSGDRSRRCRG